MEVRPKIFASASFIDALENVDLHFAGNFLEQDTTQQFLRKQRIINLLLSSNVYTNYNATNALQQIAANATYTNFKNYFLKHKLLNKSGVQTWFSTQQKSTETNCDFLHSSEVPKNSKSSPLLIDEQLDHAYFGHTNTIEQLDADISKLSINTCESLLYIDKYFAHGDYKLSRFLSFLKKHPFIKEITILSSFKADNQNRLENEKFNWLFEELKKEFPNGNIQILVPPDWAFLKRKKDGKMEYIFAADRYLLTNHQLITIGHPLDRDSYMADDNILSKQTATELVSAYSLWYRVLSDTKKCINRMSNLSPTPMIFTTGNKHIELLQYVR
ncbi:MAG: hypothetical protein EAY72_09980 [Bacteroidetes bacterium]|nr:MAG: hypothetical protein EAY72_09980 [Bacteroidota bacterium]